MGIPMYPVDNITQPMYPSHPSGQMPLHETPSVGFEGYNQQPSPPFSPEDSGARVKSPKRPTSARGNKINIDEDRSRTVCIVDFFLIYW